MATAYTYAPQGNLVNVRGAAVEGLDSGGKPMADVLTRTAVFRVGIPTGADGDTHTITVPFRCRVIDAWTVASATVTSATARLSNATNNITAALVFATADALVRAATLDVTYVNVAKGGTLKWTMANAGVGDLYVLVQVLD